MQEKNSSTEDREPNTTVLALDRTILANERTYAAWIRTGMAALISGLAVEKFMLEALPLWGIHTIAVILIASSSVAFFLAAWRYRHLHVHLEDADVAMVPLAVVRAFSFFLALCALIALVGIWTS
jgi:putative membrane protein